MRWRIREGERGIKLCGLGWRGHVSITEGETEGCAGRYCRRYISDEGGEECENMWSEPEMETKINSGTRSKDLIANHS